MSVRPIASELEGGTAELEGPADITGEAGTQAAIMMLTGAQLRMARLHCKLRGAGALTRRPELKQP